MNKTNRFTLIATILLGVLLFVIMRFAADLNVAWDGGELEPPPVTEASQLPELPRIAAANDLRVILDRQGMDANALIVGYDEWSDARGFTGRHRLFAATAVAPPAEVQAVDSAGLRVLSDGGDAAASRALAKDKVFDDLFAALELYRRSAEQGSTFALLRIASVLEALAVAEDRQDPANSDRKPGDQRRRIDELAAQGPGNDLRLTALGYVLTAIRDGGAPIIDYPLLEWLDRLHDTASTGDRAAACEWSERTLLDIARTRALWQKPAITIRPPPVFFSVPDFVERMPCRDTAFPVENLLDLSGCSTMPVVNATGEPLDLYLCGI